MHAVSFVCPLLAVACAWKTGWLNLAAPETLILCGQLLQSMLDATANPLSTTGHDTPPINGNLNHTAPLNDSIVSPVLNSNHLNISGAVGPDVLVTLFS